MALPSKDLREVFKELGERGQYFFIDLSALCDAYDCPEDIVPLTNRMMSEHRITPLFLIDIKDPCGLYDAHSVRAKRLLRKFSRLVEKVAKESGNDDEFDDCDPTVIDRAVAEFLYKNPDIVAIEIMNPYARVYVFTWKR